MEDFYHALAEASTSYDHGYYEEAVKTLHRARVISEFADVSCSERLKFLHLLAMIYHAQGKQQDAFALFGEILPLVSMVVDTCSSIATPDLEPYLIVLNNMAQLYLSAGEYEMAATITRGNLHILELSSPCKLPVGAAIASTMATILELQGNFDEAEQLHCHALQLRSTGLPDESAGQIFNGFGVFLNKLGKHAESEMYFTRAMELIESGKRTFPTILNNLAMVKLHQGKYTEASSMFVRVISMLTLMVGAHHEQLIPVLRNLARTQLLQGNFDAAEQSHKRTFSILERLDINHSQVGAVLGDLGDVRYERGDLNGALALYQQSLSLLDATDVGNSGDHYNALSRLAITYHELGKYDEAERFYNNAIDSPVPYPNQKILLLCQFARFYAEIGKPFDAEPLCDRIGALIRDNRIEPDIRLLAALQETMAVLGNNESLASRKLAIILNGLRPHFFVDYPNAETREMRGSLETKCSTFSQSNRSH